VTRADSADFSESTEIYRRYVTRVRHGDRIRLTYFWNLDTKVITFKVLNLTRRSQKVLRLPFRRFVDSPENPIVSPNRSFWGNIQSRTILPRCRPDRGVVRRPAGMMDADFDNIFVYRPRG